VLKLNKTLGIDKTIKKIYNELCKLNKHTISFIKLGANISIFLFASGTLLSVLNRFVFNHDPYKEFIATSVINSSFTILAEVVIGCLLVDYAFSNK